MPALCADCPSKVLEVLDNGCFIKGVPADAGQHCQSAVHLAVPDFEELRFRIPVVHASCPCNEFIAIHNRVCGTVPPTTAVGLERVQIGFDLIKASLPKTVQQDLDLFFQKYGGAKRARYQRALDSLLACGLHSSDSRVSAFVKPEKIAANKNNPDPRMIQFRDAKYCVLLASYLKPIEEHLYALKIKHPLLSCTRLIGKGLNQIDRAKLYVRKLECFKKPVTISIDASRFDKHVSAEMLEEEHKVYTNCCNDPRLASLLREQLQNKVKTKSGFRYVTRGKRMSGDMNTALGNCIIMLAMVLSFMVPRNVKFDILDDGDDCLLIFEEEHLEAILHDIKPFFLEFGQEVKVEGVSREPQTTTWCQCNPIQCAYGWKFVRDPLKVMGNSLINNKWVIPKLRVKLEHLAAIAQCEMVLNSGVPVLHAYAEALLRRAGDAVPRFEPGTGEYIKYVREMRYYKFTDAHEQPITDLARSHFAQAFGISVDRQLDMEEHLKTWTPLFSDVTLQPAERDPATWRIERESWPEFY